MSHGDAVEMRSAKIRQVAVNRRIELDLASIDQQHRRHRRCHDLGNGREVEHGRCSHWSGGRKTTSFIVIELLVPKCALVNDSTILGNEKYRAWNELPDRHIDK